MYLFGCSYSNSYIRGHTATLLTTLHTDFHAVSEFYHSDCQNLSLAETALKGPAARSHVKTTKDLRRGVWLLWSVAVLPSTRSHKLWGLLSFLWHPGATRRGLGTAGLSIAGSAKLRPSSPARLSSDHVSFQNSLHAFTPVPALTVTCPRSIYLNLLVLWGQFRCLLLQKIRN